jgi:hypothetical protein
VQLLISLRDSRSFIHKDLTMNESLGTFDIQVEALAREGTDGRGQAVQCGVTTSYAAMCSIPRPVSRTDRARHFLLIFAGLEPIHKNTTAYLKPGRCLPLY